MLADSASAEARRAAGEEQRGAHAERDRLAVEQLAVGHGGLDAVADGVAEVEQGADAGGFVFVRLDDRGP